MRGRGPAARFLAAFASVFTLAFASGSPGAMDAWAVEPVEISVSLSREETEGEEWTEGETGAQETGGDLETELLDEMDISDIQEFLRKEASESPDFRQIMEDLMAGRLLKVCEGFLESAKEELFSELSFGIRAAGQILTLGILGAVFTNFSDVFDKSQVSETAFYVTYLLMTAILAAGLGQSAETASRTVSQILRFMQVLAPSYFLAVAFAGGSASAMAMYEGTLLLITGGQWLLHTVLISLVRIHILLSLAGNLGKEAYFGKLTELLRQAAGWGMKTLLGLALGFHLIQGMILPYVDALKNGSVQKLMSLIPGVGQGAAALTQVLLGSGVLIKNTMGMAAVVILAAVTAVPAAKLLLLTLLYRLLAVLLEPVCDRRLVACVTAAADGHQMLLQIVMTAAFLLVITVALVCAGTNVTYYA